MQWTTNNQQITNLSKHSPLPSGLTYMLWQVPCIHWTTDSPLGGKTSLERCGIAKEDMVKVAIPGR
jgi:hypothetical protein